MRLLALVLAIGVAGSVSAQSTLPAGHPPLPAGHPVLPSGHPDISKVTPPASQPATHGGIALRVVQGTQGGTSVAGAPFTAELYHQGKVIRKIDGKLDDKGIATIEGLPLLLAFQPVVRMMHGGVEYAVTGSVMDNLHPNQQLEMRVFDTTEQVPAWQVHMLHVMATPTAEGLSVRQVLAIQNPIDRTWRGKADDKGNRTTLSLPMPAGAQNIVVSGFLEHGSALTEDGRIVTSEPVQPGVAQAQITYLVPGKGGQANIKVTTPAPAKTVILFLPDDSAAKVEGLELAGVRDMGKGKLRMFRGSELKAGHEVAMQVTLPQAASVPSAAANNAPKIIAGVGVGLIVVIGAFLVVLKTPKAKGK